MCAITSIHKIINILQNIIYSLYKRKIYKQFKYCARWHNINIFKNVSTVAKL